MALRRLSWINWLEIIFGALLPTICIAPLAIVWLVGGIRGMFAGDLGLAWAMSILTLFSVIGVAALVSLWVLLLMGPEQINQHLVFRSVVTIALFAGAALGTFIIYAAFEKAIRSARLGSAFTWQEGGLWMLLLGPVIVALRYLPALTKGKRA